MNQVGQHLEKHLLDGAVSEPKIALDERILGDDTLISNIAQAWGTYRDAISAVIQTRINILETHIARHASPYDVLALREAVAHLDHLLADFHKYTEEVERRKKEEEEGSPPDPVHR